MGKFSPNFKENKLDNFSAYFSEFGLVAFFKAVFKVSRQVLRTYGHLLLNLSLSLLMLATDATSEYRKKKHWPELLIWFGLNFMYLKPNNLVLSFEL